MHIPVLLQEVLTALDPKPGENFVDCTFGLGGHARAIQEKCAPGKVLGIEWEQKQVLDIKVVNDNYANLEKIVAENNFSPVNGILLDLGMSSEQIENSGKGFSFLRDEKLDMRFGEGDLTAEFIVNNWREDEIERILGEYGEEKYARKIAKEIARDRGSKPIKTTFQLVEIIERVVKIREKIHPATRTFQALRIAVNGELDNLRSVLPQAERVLAEGGRLAIISFHSLEDRIVKNYFKNSKNLKILNKKPITASREEIVQNPRARSAKLRVATKK